MEDQASDRAHRIGQTQTVTVIRLLAENTIETHILRLQQEKRRIADNILTDNISSLSLLEIEELLEYLQQSSSESHIVTKPCANMYKRSKLNHWRLNDYISICSRLWRKS